MLLGPNGFGPWEVYVKPHELTRVEGTAFSAECLSCGELVPVSNTLDSRDMALRVAQLEHQVKILMEAAENRKPTR